MRLLAILMTRFKQNLLTLFLAMVLAALVSEWLFIQARREVLRSVSQENREHRLSMLNLVEKLEMQMGLFDVQRFIRNDSETVGGDITAEDDHVNGTPE
jgi:hypothetical protein